MAQNVELENVVLDAIYEQVKDKSRGIMLPTKGDKYLVREILRNGAKVMVDLPYKVRVHIGTIIGYGYDFEKPNDKSMDTRAIYKRAVKNTKKFGISPHVETFIADGCINNRYGWYITSVKARHCSSR